MIDPTNPAVVTAQPPAPTAIFEYLETYYNPKRRHSTLGFLSPVEFEERAYRADSTM
jgi:putative transposase